MDEQKTNTPELKQILAELCDSNPRVQQQAARSLGQRREQSAVPGLIALLVDDTTHWETASVAAWALGEVGERAAVPALVTALGRRLVSGAAIEALAKRHDERAI